MAGFCVEFLNGVLAILTLSIKYNFSIYIWKCIILLRVNSLKKHDLRCHICKICWLRMSIWRRKDEGEKTKAKRRKDESEKTKRRRRKDEKTKAKRRKDESEKTLNSGLHVFVFSLFRLRYFVMSPSLFRYVAFVISSFRLFAFVFSSFRFRLFVFSLWRLRYVAAK